VHRQFSENVGDQIVGGFTAIGYNDQVAWAVDELKRNPMSRRVVVSAWAPGNAQTSKLPPCHAMFVLNVQNMPTGISDPIMEQRLCLHLTQRSCDMALGVPYNIAGYALLLKLFARFTGIKAGIFAHTLIDAHIYTAKPDGSKAEFDHMPGLREQLERTPRKLPKLYMDSSIQSLDDINRLLEKDTATIMEHFVLEGYDPAPAIPFKVAV
jgi:thymidylate synthase